MPVSGCLFSPFVFELLLLPVFRALIPLCSASFGNRLIWKLGLSGQVYQVIEREKYKAPFPIQMQAIPVIMSGRDCIGCAKTVGHLPCCCFFPSLFPIPYRPSFLSFYSLDDFSTLLILVVLSWVLRRVPARPWPSCFR